MTTEERPERRWVGCEDPAARAAFLAWTLARAALPTSGPSFSVVRVLDVGRGADELPRVLLDVGGVGARPLAGVGVGGAGARPLLDEIDALGTIPAGVAVTASVPLLDVVRKVLDGSVILGSVTQADVFVARGAVVVADRPPGSEPGVASVGASVGASSVAAPVDAWGGEGIAALVGLCRTLWRRVPPDEPNVPGVLEAVDALLAAVRSGPRADAVDPLLDEALATVRSAAMPRPFRPAPSGIAAGESGVRGSSARGTGAPASPGALGVGGSRMAGSRTAGSPPGRGSRIEVLRARVTSLLVDGVGVGPGRRFRLGPRHLLTVVLVTVGLVVAASALLDGGTT